MNTNKDKFKNINYNSILNAIYIILLTVSFIFLGFMFYKVSNLVEVAETSANKVVSKEKFKEHDIYIHQHIDIIEDSLKQINKKLNYTDNSND